MSSESDGIAADGDAPETTEPTEGPAQTAEPTEEATEEPTQTTEPTEEETEEPAVTILDHEWVVIEEYESDAVEDDYGVVGTAQNNWDVRLDVFLEARFYDDEDVQIDSSNASMNGVAADGKFEFEIPFLGDSADDAARYEIAWEAYEA